MKSSGSGLENSLPAVGTRCADYAAPLYPQKLVLTSPTTVGRSVDLVCLLVKVTDFVPFVYLSSNALYATV
jgi:hypothetical protein